MVKRLRTGADLPILGAVSGEDLSRLLAVVRDGQPAP